MAEAHTGTSSGGSTAIVAIVAIVLLVALGFFVLRGGFGRRGGAPSGGSDFRGKVEINVPKAPAPGK